MLFYVNEPNIKSDFADWQNSNNFDKLKKITGMEVSIKNPLPVKLFGTEKQNRHPTNGWE